MSASEEQTSNQPTRVVETRPTIKPTAIWMAITLLVGTVISVEIAMNPQEVGGAATAEVLYKAVALLTIIGIIRLSVRAWILRRTQYQITDDEVRRTYDLLFRKWSRRVPLKKVRSHEHYQTRVQRMLGYGTISINQGLGEIELEDIPHPEDIQATLAEQVERTGDV